MQKRTYKILSELVVVFIRTDYTCRFWKNASKKPIAECPIPELFSKSLERNDALIVMKDEFDEFVRWAKRISGWKEEEPVFGVPAFDVFDGLQDMFDKIQRVGYFRSIRAQEFISVWTGRK